MVEGIFPPEAAAWVSSGGKWRQCKRIVAHSWCSCTAYGHKIEQILFDIENRSLAKVIIIIKTVYLPLSIYTTIYQVGKKNQSREHF